MRNRNNHSITFKKKLNKSGKLFRAYSELQLKYGEALDLNDDVVDIRFNVLLKDFELGDSFTTDFVCYKRSGEMMVREVVYKKNLLKPAVIKMLDASHNYWLSRGVKDCVIVVGE